MIQNIHAAHWKHAKKKAELMSDNITLIEMEFGPKQAVVKMGKEKLEISKNGFWRSKIIITQNEKLVSMQRQLGFWGTETEFVIDDQRYFTKTKQGALFNVTYCNDNSEIFTYKLGVVKTKPIINFEIKYADIPEKHLLILLALGFYSIKNVAIETMSSDFVVTAVA